MEIRLQRRDVRRVVAPAARGTLIETLSHLPHARGLHGSRRLLERQTRFLPFEAAEPRQPFDGGARLAHQRVVVEIEDVRAVERLPVRHQSPVLHVVVRDVREIERVAHAVIEMQEVDRQAVVERIAHRVHDPGVREQALDEADVQEVVRSLVGDALAVREQPREHVEIARGQLLQLCRRHARASWPEMARARCAPATAGTRARRPPQRVSARPESAPRASNLSETFRR